MPLPLPLPVHVPGTGSGPGQVSAKFIYALINFIQLRDKRSQQRSRERERETLPKATADNLSLHWSPGQRIAAQGSVATAHYESVALCPCPWHNDPPHCWLLLATCQKIDENSIKILIDRPAVIRSPKLIALCSALRNFRLQPVRDDPRRVGCDSCCDYVNRGRPRSRTRSSPGIDPALALEPETALPAA